MQLSLWSSPRCSMNFACRRYICHQRGQGGFDKLFPPKPYVLCSATVASNLAGVSDRVLATDNPVIVKTKELIKQAGREDVLSLAQGVVHWSPPQSALDAAATVLKEPATSSYGPCDGLPDLVAALQKKLEVENNLHGYDVMVTAGANQAFVNLVLTLLDPSDPVVLYSPYYFNHLMALQMTGGAENVVFGPCNPQSMHPDLDWLELQLSGARPPKMVVLINPCNPTGVLLARPELERAAELCKKAGCWLVMDSTYEHFVFGNREHVSIAGDHIIHLFSFSKAFGMMGWRTGYIAYRDKNGLAEQLRKVQDTIPICPPQLSQHVALQATREGRPWVQRQLESLLGNREVLLDALSPLGTLGDGIAGGEGAIYIWARLSEGFRDDEAVVAWLVKEHGVCVIPGSSCGAPGFIRVAFGNLQADVCREAAARLKRGLQQLIQEGLPLESPSPMPISKEEGLLLDQSGVQ